MPFEAELGVAKAAALEAGNFIRAQVGELERDDVREKGIHDLVTYADEESQRLIIRVIKESFPEHHFLAEEGSASILKNESVADLWIIDPIDGTTNFTRGLPPFSVSIALQRNGETVVGVVLEVAQGELFWATKNGGFFVNGHPKHVSKESVMRRSLITTGFPYRSFKYIDSYLVVLRRFMFETQGVRRPGSAAADLAYVACGRFEGFFETGLSAWDVAAGALLIREAGGTVTDFAGGDSFMFGGQIVASNGIIHDQMLDMTLPLREAILEEEQHLS